MRNSSQKHAIPIFDYFAQYFVFQVLLHFLVFNSSKCSFNQHSLWHSIYLLLVETWSPCESQASYLWFSKVSTFFLWIHASNCIYRRAKRHERIRTWMRSILKKKNDITPARMPHILLRQNALSEKPEKQLHGNILFIRLRWCWSFWVAKTSLFFLIAGNIFVVG